MVYHEPKPESENRLESVSLSARQTQEQLLFQLSGVRDETDLGMGLAALAAYSGAKAFLLARYDLVSDQSLSNIIASDWPFDIVRRMNGDILAACGRNTEIEKCILTLQPGFGILPEDITLPASVGSQYCWIDFVVGNLRYRLMFLLQEDMVASVERVRHAGLLASYLVSSVWSHKVSAEREADLTDREVECLYWIAEGKTSEEIALILGISRNTINNYITSIMRKTSTRNRPEAVAYAVRNHLV